MPAPAALRAPAAGVSARPTRGPTPRAPPPAPPPAAPPRHVAAAAKKGGGGGGGKKGQKKGAGGALAGLLQKKADAAAGGGASDADGDARATPAQYRDPDVVMQLLKITAAYKKHTGQCVISAPRGGQPGARGAARLALLPPSAAAAGRATDHQPITPRPPQVPHRGRV